MRQTSVMDIIVQCQKIDEAARDIYARLSDLAGEEKQSAFWAQMSREEAEHVDFWKRAALVEELTELPELFEKPEQVYEELEKSLSRSKELLVSCENEYNTSAAFVTAYRMEFYLLHPAFAILFNLVGKASDIPNPQDQYESHIGKFIDMLESHGNVTPELELLGETIKRLWKENKNLTFKSSQDDLTGVLNRRGFFSISEQFAYLAQRSGSRMSVMMIDLDHFKSINDSLGHAVGDRVLQETARLLTERLRESDLIGRYGGEEFIVMLTDVVDGATANLAETLRKTIEDNPFEDTPVTISIGFSEAQLGQNVRESYYRLIKQADNALYQAKEAGRNRVVEYQS